MLQISKLQVFVITFGSVVSTGILAVPRIAAGLAGSGGWLVVFIFGLLNTLFSVILVKLMERFPNGNFISIGQQLIGNIGGYIIGLLVFAYTTSVGAAVARNMAETSTTNMFPTTPIAVLTGLMIALALYLVYHGIEVLARVNLILFALKLVLIIVVLIMAIPGVNIDYLKPLWYRGNEAWATGTIKLVLSYQGIIIVAFIYQYINNKKAVAFTMAGAMIVITVNYTLITLLVIALFGANETARMIWPTMYMVRQLTIPVEPVFVAIWLTSSFTVISSNLFIAGQGMAYLFKLTDYRHILLPLGVLTTILANITTNQGDVAIFNATVGYLGLLLEWLIPPMFLLLAILLKKRE